MSESKTIRVSILDQDYQVSCEKSEVAALQQSAQYLDQKMREMKENSSVFGLDRLAVMAALNLTNDLLAQSEKATQLTSKQSEITSRLTDQQNEIEQLHKKVDSALSRLKTKN
ncbi:MAG: cell division protein ZapA [Candidatus Azotimanducaceae bacterium WSBS_2022_MAG_OTU7]